MRIELICPKCNREGRTMTFAMEFSGNAELKGTITCLTCQHERPFAMLRSFMQELSIDLPGAQSNELTSLVPEDIRDDVREAERANFAQCYKACVAMCRRALQLSLIEKGIDDKPLSLMLKDALNDNLLDQDTFNLATSIKGYGDIGLHRREQLNPQEVKMVIYATVRMVNEVFSHQSA